MLFPVPLGASRVDRLGSVRGGEDTCTVLKIVSLEAAQAAAGRVVGLALIANCHANLVGVEGPSFGALEASLAVPAPLGTSTVGWFSVVEVREDALAVL